MTPDRMKRPVGMYDGDWEEFEYELGTRHATLADYNAFLEATNSTLEQEWNEVREGVPTHTRGVESLVLAMTAYHFASEQRSVATLLADELMSRLIDPLMASLYAEELSELLIGHDNEKGNRILASDVPTHELADDVLQMVSVERLVKSFLFDRLCQGGAVRSKLT